MDRNPKNFLELLSYHTMTKSSQTSLWQKKISRTWARIEGQIKPSQKESPAQLLLKGFALLAQQPAPLSSAQTLPGQPLDSALLLLSPLYRKSRSQYLKQKGQFQSAFISSPRTLSSSSLLQNTISYTPLEDELFWAATDRLERRNPAHLLTLRSYISNVFHEQNHRILLQFLPGAPAASNELGRYLNFMESLVITLDIALSDELGALGTLFHTCGVTYNPGSLIKEWMDQPRTYRNYLQAILYSTYLNLELFHPRDIKKIICRLFPTLGELGHYAVERSCQLDRKFVLRTNPHWQKKHGKLARKSLQRPVAIISICTCAA